MVDDLEESIKYYQEIVGLSVNRRFEAGPGMEIAFLGDGGTEVELACDTNQKIPGRIEGISLGFAVDSLDAQIELIKAKGFEVESGPFVISPQLSFFFTRDPNGLRIQFIEKK